MAEWIPIARNYDPLKAGSIDGTDMVPHDNAVFRAMNAKYKPNKDVVSVPENTVFVGRLNFNTDEETVETYFSKYGKIKSFRLVRDIVTGFSKGYAFIEYFDEDSAYRTQKNLDKTFLDEKEIYVDFECERVLRGWIPRRLGGGIGGKKESGQLRYGGKSRPFKKPYSIENVIQPEGKTFRDRLRAVDEGYGRSRERDQGRDREDWSQKERRSDKGSRRDYDRRDRNRSRSKERGTRDSRDYSGHRDSMKRSRSRERHRRN